MNPRGWLLVIAAAALAGCAMVERAIGYEPRASLRQVLVVAEVGANQDLATALDLVFVYDARVIEVLPKTGPEWFAARNVLLAQLSSAIEVVGAGIPPAGAYRIDLPPRHGRAVAVFGYANYLAPGGQAVRDLTRFRCVRLQLAPRTISQSACA